MIRRLLILMAALLLPVAASAQSSDYVKFLLPLTPATVLGQDGAVWEVELTLANASFQPLALYCFTGTCGAIDPRGVHRVEAPPRDSIVPGLMYVPAGQARRIFAGLRSRNSTPNSEERNFVSEIPVVPETDMRSEVVEITAVPIEPNYRHMLRVYDANANEAAEVRVRIYGMRNGAVVTGALVDQTLTLRTSRGSASPFERPDEPSWAALPGFGDMPEIRNYEEVHIRVESLDTNMEIWAFATATNNTTQRFAVYTP